MLLRMINNKQGCKYYIHLSEMLERCFYVLMIKFTKMSQEIKWAKERVTVLKIHQF